MLNIGGVQIGAGQPCRTVAEMSNAANGSLDRALRIVDAAKEAGADLLKLQLYTADELVRLRGDGPAPEPWGSQGWTMRNLYQKAHTPADWLPAIVRRCEGVGLPWFSSVFGAESLGVLEDHGCEAYKIAALDAGASELHSRVRATGKPILASDRRQTAPTWCDFPIWCPEGYPQTHFAYELAFLEHGYLGVSYHGTDPLIPTVAAAFGAQLIEVHLHLSAEPSELEAAVSLDEVAFARMVQMLRWTEEED